MLKRSRIRHLELELKNAREETPDPEILGLAKELQTRVRFRLHDMDQPDIEAAIVAEIKVREEEINTRAVLSLLTELTPEKQLELYRRALGKTAIDPALERLVELNHRKETEKAALHELRADIQRAGAADLTKIPKGVATVIVGTGIVRAYQSMYSSEKQIFADRVLKGHMVNGEDNVFRVVSDGVSTGSGYTEDLFSPLGKIQDHNTVRLGSYFFSLDQLADFEPVLYKDGEISVEVSPEDIVRTGLKLTALAVGSVPMFGADKFK